MLGRCVIPGTTLNLGPLVDLIAGFCIPAASPTVVLLIGTPPIALVMDATVGLKTLLSLIRRAGGSIAPISAIPSPDPGLCRLIVVRADDSRTELERARDTRFIALLICLASSLSAVHCFSPSEPFSLLSKLSDGTLVIVSLERRPEVRLPVISCSGEASGDDDKNESVGGPGDESVMMPDFFDKNPAWNRLADGRIADVG